MFDFTIRKNLVTSRKNLDKIWISLLTIWKNAVKMRKSW